METVIPFLIKAKRNCYAAGMIPVSSTRKNSKDLHYSEGDLRYLDSYFGAERFLGQEVVWKKNREVWGMNYYGLPARRRHPRGLSGVSEAGPLTAG